MDISTCVLEPMKAVTASVVNEWAYPPPYDVYCFKGRDNGFLLDEKLWGIEQFCLVTDNHVIGQIACQQEDDILWIGWSLAPELCGQGNGTRFIQKCIEEIRLIKAYEDSLYLRVAAWNKRAIKAYEKAGFIYVDKILDEIAYSGKFEDFWVMKQG